MPKAISAGRMDREITVVNGTPEQDPDSGEEVITWVPEDVPTWAEWLPAGTREAWQAQQRLSAYVDGVFRIYDRTPRPTAAFTRILFQGRMYDVKPVIEIGRGDGLEVPVVARADT